MKRITFPFILFVLLPLHLLGQQTREVPRLSGIVHLPGVQEAVFEFHSSSGDWPKQEVLALNEDGWHGVRLVEILPDWRSVRIALKGNPAEVTLSLDGQFRRTADAADTLVITNCSLYSVLELYGEFSQRTLLIWPTLAAATFSLTAAATNQAQVAAVLQKALEQKQIVTIPDGAKFAMVLPKDKATSVRPHAPPSAAPGVTKPSAEQLDEGGTVNWRGVDINQVYFIYAELLGGKMDRNAPRPQVNNGPIFLISESPLSKEESLYALDTLLAWRGVKMVKAGDGSVKAVSTSQ